jgi:pSer/pThr/pTyr-binding forkhead associated (FHA) protein
VKEGDVMKLSLVVLTPGKQQGKVIPVLTSPFLIGRDPECHLRPASPIISARHCAVALDGNRASVRDLHSTNGTFVNGKRVQGEAELLQGDHLQVGPLAFSVRLEGSTPVNRPTPLPPIRASQGPAAVEDAVAKAWLEMPDAEVSPAGSTSPAVPPVSATTKKDQPAVGSATEAARVLLKQYYHHGSHRTGGR